MTRNGGNVTKTEQLLDIMYTELAGDDGCEIRVNSKPWPLSSRGSKQTLGPQPSVRSASQSRRLREVQALSPESPEDEPKFQTLSPGTLNRVLRQILTEIKP